MKFKPKLILDRSVFKIINDAVKKITLPELKQTSVKSLTNFYRKLYNETRQISEQKIQVATALSHLILDKHNYTAKRILTRNGFEVVGSRVLGVPMQKFAEDYVRENLQPTLDKLAKEKALDPGDVSGRNTLRNRAEMEVRYAGHAQNIQQLKEQGVRLVIASVHADCSPRCRPWQGRVYSLDGTSGVTDDGRKFIPLEVARDIPYTTKAGKVYMNGLLGFNCRHYLVPYESGKRFVKPSLKEEKEQYAVTQKQRQFESGIRKWRVEAITNKGVNDKRYKFAKKKATDLTKDYIAYCKEHKRPYYPSWIEII